MEKNMTTSVPQFHFIDKIFNDDQQLVEQSTNLYNTVIEEVPEIANFPIYISLYDSQQSDKYNFNYVWNQNKTFFKNCSIGKIYHSDIIYNFNTSSTIRTYFIQPFLYFDSWLVGSSNYSKIIDNKFTNVWYNYTNIVLDIDMYEQFAESSFYSQQVKTNSEDFISINNQIVQIPSDKAVLYDSNLSVNWICKTKQPYLRIHLYGLI